MGSVNQVNLLGNLGRDPDVRYTSSGKKVVNLSLATSRRWKDDAGQAKEATDWHRIVVWGKNADVAEEFLKKGSPVFVEGRLATRSYEKDGSKRYVTEVVARRLQLVGKADAPAGDPPAQEDPPADEEPEHEDIPF